MNITFRELGMRILNMTDAQKDLILRGDIINANHSTNNPFNNLRKSGILTYRDMGQCIMLLNDRQLEQTLEIEINPNL